MTEICRGFIGKRENICPTIDKLSENADNKRETMLEFLVPRKGK